MIEQEADSITVQSLQAVARIRQAVEMMRHNVAEWHPRPCPSSWTQPVTIHIYSRTNHHIRRTTR